MAHSLVAEEPPGAAAPYVAARGVPTDNQAWPQWRGPQRDGRSPSENLDLDWQDETPRLLWQASGAGSGYASVSIADGKVFSTGNFDSGQAVVAWRQSDGERLWSRAITEAPPEHGYQGSRSTPTFDDGKLYVVGSDGSIACLAADSGDLIWERAFDDWDGEMMSGWGFSESPLVDGERVVCTPGGADAAIVALDKNSGEELWRAAIPEFGDGKSRTGETLKSGAAYSSMVISEARGVRQYIQVLGQGVVSVRADDGQFLWGYDEVVNNVANIPTPIVDGDFVFCSTGYGTGSALLRVAGRGRRLNVREVYFLDARRLQNHHGGMVLINGFLYGGHGHNNGFPICVEMRTGRIRWGGDERGPGQGSAAVIYADGNLIFRYQDGTMASIEASPRRYRLRGTFMPEFQERESWAHPVVVGDRLYLREQDVLMCYDLSHER